MKPSARYIIFTVSFFLTFSCIFEALSDDDHYKKRYRYRGERQKVDDDRNGHDNKDHLKPVTNQTYKETCGGCHFTYQPELLPSVSWLKILNQLDNHFWEEIETDPATIKNISDYLTTNGAENSSAKRSVKIMRCLGGQIPIRITDIPYIRKKHHELDPAIFKRKSIGSLSNCIACHTTAENGIYDDDDVKIPEWGEHIMIFFKLNLIYNGTWHKVTHCGIKKIETAIYDFPLMPKLNNIFILDIHLWPASHLAFLGNVKNYKIVLTANYLAWIKEGVVSFATIHLEWIDSSLGPPKFFLTLQGMPWETC